jgi:hypothetical protein
MKTLTAVILAIASFFLSQQILSAENSQPSNLQQEWLQLRDRISQNGITWTFNAKVPVGRFVNGDYYVVGDVTIVSITPKPEEGRNGSVLNLPTYPAKSGFDARVKQVRSGTAVRCAVRYRTASEA